jgi:hypothetical protein
MIFCAGQTNLGDCRVPQSRASADHRRVLNWKLINVKPAGEPAANEPWPAHFGGYAPRRQVSITRLGAYTRVVLVAAEEEAPAISSQQWA